MLPFHWSPHLTEILIQMCVCVCVLSMIKPVLVLRVPHSLGTRVNVPLTCLEDYQNQPVFWKKNGNTAVTTTDTTSTTKSSQKMYYSPISQSMPQRAVHKIKTVMSSISRIYKNVVRQTIYKAL